VAVASRPREPQAPRRPSEEQPPVVVGFLRGVVDELRKVVWPTWAELYRYTVVVVVTVVIIGLFIGAVDLAAHAAAAKWLYPTQ
jgi:preprotein translocase subunit SecE